MRRTASARRVEDVRKGLIGKIGENMSIRRFKRYAGGGKLASYLHGTRIGVIVEFAGDDVAAKDVAMHVAAMKPVALSSADVPAELIEKERSVAAAKAAEIGQAGRDRRQDGRRLGAEVPEGSHPVQPGLREETTSRPSSRCSRPPSTTVKGFTLYVVGEGIEKKVDDFAAEVAAQVAAAKGA